MLKIFLIAFVLLVIAFAGWGIRLLLNRKAEFSGGSCQAGEPGQKSDTCGCSGGYCMAEEEKRSAGMNQSG